METTVYRIGGYRKSTDGTVQVLVFLSQSSSGCLFFSFSSRLLRNILLSSFQFSFHSFQLPFCFLLRISTFFRVSSYQFLFLSFSVHILDLPSFLSYLVPFISRIPLPFLHICTEDDGTPQPNPRHPLPAKRRWTPWGGGSGGGGAGTVTGGEIS